MPPGHVVLFADVAALVLRPQLGEDQHLAVRADVVGQLAAILAMPTELAREEDEDLSLRKPARAAHLDIAAHLGAVLGGHAAP